MNKLVKYIVERTYRPLLVKYLSKTRIYCYKDIILEIPSEVFHPGFFFSTRLLLRYISKEALPGKEFLELGAGSGLLSIYAAKKNAVVTATDINPVAVKYLHRNAEKNEVAMDIIHSDLFENVPDKKFDMVVINPPYYKKDPVSNLDHAWYCGENGEFFQRLFNELGGYIHDTSNIIMVLCDGCDLQMIREIASRNSFGLQCVYTKTTWLEKNYIFKIIRAAT